MDKPGLSAMASEIAEIPRLARALLSRQSAAASLAERIAAAAPRLMMTCGRGSSGHAGVYTRYLFETRLAMLTSSAAPSVFTAYGARPAMQGTLFIAISQSGRSPDLLAAITAAREQGALTLAIVNDSHSALADRAELTFPIEAGAERAVAATKTVVLSMVAGAMLTAALARDGALAEALKRLPDRFQQALGCDWSPWEQALVSAPAAFVAGRGYGYAPAREIALKLTETVCIPALGFSTAELRHGPRAAISASTPVLLLEQQDQTAAGVRELGKDLKAAGVPVFVAGSAERSLPWIGSDHPACDPLTMMLPAYLAIEGAARARGLDPDHPPHLSKVTRTW